MALNIDKDIIDKAKNCIFAKMCLENFDSTLCCDIVEQCTAFLVVKPTSSFKSSNCLYCNTINNDGTDVHICSCPVRIELYKEFGG